MRLLTSSGRVLGTYWRSRLYGTAAKDVRKAIKQGDKLHGYTVKKVSEVPELYLTAIALEHDTTGAQHLHTARDDDNNTFGVAFRTTPLDNTGVPHILEHTTLCGSDKFPVRDPFFKMLSRSLATFMNAFTAYDWTMYPFSSQNPQDFQNLLSVYLDAVFRPTLRELDFKQEGWRLEPEDPSNPSSPLTFKGVVYNEMKGVFSSSQALFNQVAHNKLQPSHTYGVVSGGDPAYIPDLTWQQLKDFHATHYHPSNSRFFTYGSFPLENHLEYINTNYLQHFSRIPVNTSVPAEPRWKQPRETSITCAPDPMAADQDKQTSVCISYLLNDMTDSEESFTMSVICTLLVDGETAPFYKSLLEANIGSDYSPAIGYDGHTREATFSVGLQGIHEKDTNRVRQIIADTFDKVIQEGFEQKRIDALLHSIELALKHQSSNFGLGLGVSVISHWIHDSDPSSHLQINERVAQFKERLKDNPRFLQEKVQQYFKNNPHNLTVSMTPESSYEVKRQEAEKAKLDSLVSVLTDKERQVIITQTQELLGKQDAAEDLSCLPTLRVSDLNKNIKQEIVDTTSLGGVPIQYSKQPTNEVVYVTLLSNMADLPPHLYPYVPLFCSVITKMGAGPYDYKSLSEEMQLYTGGLSSGLTIASHHTEPYAFQQGVAFSSHCLERNLNKMAELWTHIFTSPDLKDLNRLTTLINMAASDMASSLSNSGHSYAMKHSSAGLSPAAQLSETFSGVTQVTTMKKIAESGDHTELVQHLQEIGKHILSKQNIRVMVNATPQFMDTVLGKMERFLSDIPGSPGGGATKLVKNPSFAVSSSHTQFELPFSVNYMSKSVPGVIYSHPDYARLRILANLLSRKFLHREIREKGGAYGSGAACNSGVFSFFSYRDPHSLQTLDVFEEAGQWAAGGKFTDQDIDEAKLGIFQQVDKPVPPGDRGTLVFINSITDDMRQAMRDQLFAVSRKDVTTVANKYLLNKSGARGVSFLGPANATVQADNTWKVIKE
ncbi:presequence protease, mitochondrial-like isoform X1 [Haliotis rufescens]|uniref:presequence protease, mitochondrial-like isoform X1 n=2 Tax=Haliotis rufescens TaxID=6454 RepID=UPI00201E8F26|nr:presequence protease, mitochondrial-like isoform X1 [Haliotis rufescens]